MSDGKVVFDTSLNTKGLTKELSRLKSQILKTTSEINIKKDMFSQLSAQIKQAKSEINSIKDASKDESGVVVLSPENAARIAEIRSSMEPIYAEMAKIESSVDSLNVKLGATQRQYDGVAQAAMAAASASQQTGSGTSGLMSGLKSAAGNAGNLAKTLGGAVVSGVQKIGSGVKSAASGILKMVKNSLSVKKSFSGMGSSLKNAATAMLSVHGVIGILRKAVSAFMEENQALSSQLSNAWSGLGNILGPIITKVVNLVATAISYVTQFLSLLGLMGSSTSKELSSAGGAAKKETDKLKGELASFDEINKLGSSDSDSGGGGGSSVGTDAVEAELPDFAVLLAEQIKNGEWGAAATTLAESLNNMISSIDWAGLGQKIGKCLDGALEFLATFITTFDWYGLGSNLATGINNIIESVDWTNLGVVLGAKFSILIKMLGGLFATLDWVSLGSALADAFMGLWNSIDWAQAAKMLSDGVIGLLTTISTAIKKIDWQKIGNDVAIFIASVDWNGVSDALFDGIGAALGGIAAFIWGLIEEAWGSVVDWWHEVAYEDGSFTIEGLLDGIWEAMKGIGTWISEHIFQPFIEGFKDAFGIHSPSTVMAEMGGYLISGLLNGITTAWATLKKWIADALQAITTAFTNAFNNVKKIVSTIWNGILSAIKTVINGIIGAINGMISGIVKGINAVIGALNKLSFTIPDWVPSLGGKSFGFSIGTISAPQIPYLAQGAVIPPNKEFLAVLGDQKSGTNIEAPLSTIQEAVALVMEDMTGGMMAGFESNLAALEAILQAILGIELDGETISKAVDNYKRKMAVVRGG